MSKQVSTPKSSGPSADSLKSENSSMKATISHLESELKISEKEIKQLHVKVKQLLKITDSQRNLRIREYAVEILTPLIKDEQMRKLFIE